MIKLTQKRVNNLVDGLNHRLTKVESDIKWIKYIGYYISATITVLIGGLII